MLPLFMFLVKNVILYQKKVEREERAQGHQADNNGGNVHTTI